MMCRPNVGFLGLGWIGRARLRSLVDAQLVNVVALADSSAEALQAAQLMAPNASTASGLAELLEHDLDALVVATPSGLHADACEAAFARGLAVFCQKPLARDANETRRVIDAARSANKLLRVDLCYRHTSALQRLRDVVQSGQIGAIHAAELTFHNAYGPDKSWARDISLAGGGCLVDLGVHLIDAAFWVLGDRAVTHADAKLFARGRALPAAPVEVEDFALGQLDLDGGTRLSVACSWQSAFGAPARIGITMHGQQGGAAFENVGGSFYDFSCFRYSGVDRECLFEGAEDWGGRAIVDWARELLQSSDYRPDPQLLRVAEALDALYGRQSSAASDIGRSSVAGLRAVS